MDQHRPLGPANLGPVGNFQRQGLAGFGLNRDLLQRPLRPVSGGGPPVGPAHLVVNIGRDAVFEQRGVQGLGVVRVDLGCVQPLVAEQPVQHLAGAAFVAGRVAQQHQRFFGRVVQAGMQLGLPEEVCGHWGRRSGGSALQGGGLTIEVLVYP